MSRGDEDRADKFATTMRWQPLVYFLPIALLVDAVVVYIGWLIWANQF